jgi:hypothetical protein
MMRMALSIVLSKDCFMRALSCALDVTLGECQARSFLLPETTLLPPDSVTDKNMGEAGSFTSCWSDGC